MHMAMVWTTLKPLGPHIAHFLTTSLRSLLRNLAPPAVRRSLSLIARSLLFAYANINGVAWCQDSSSNSVCHINNQCMEMYPRTTYRKMVKYPISKKSLKKFPRKFSRKFSHIGKWSRTPSLKRAN